MEDLGSMTYADWCRKKKVKEEPPKAAEKAASDGDDSDSFETTHTYLALKRKSPVPQAAPVLQVVPANEQPGYVCYPSTYQLPSYPVPGQRVDKPQPVVQQRVEAQPVTGNTYYCYPSEIAQPAKAVSARRPSRGAEEESSEPTSTHYWRGRTKEEVAEDEYRIAMREQVYSRNDMKPEPSRSDQQFWVVRKDGTTVLRNMKQIEGGCGPGRWERDPRYGNAYYVCEDKK